MEEIIFEKEEIYAIRRAIYNQYLIEHEKEHDEEHNHVPNVLISGFEKLGKIIIASEEEGKSSKVTIKGTKTNKNS